MNNISKLRGAAERGLVPHDNQDAIFLHLSDGWALGHGQRQWVLMRAKKRREGRYWNPVAFIATEKRILRRVLAEKGAVISSGAERVIDALPDTFKEWLAELDKCEAS